MSDNIEKAKRGRKPKEVEKKETIIEEPSVEDLNELYDKEPVPEIEEVPLIEKEIVVETIVITEEEIKEIKEFKLPSTRQEIKNRTDELPEELQVKVVAELSLQAKKWRDYLHLQKLSPEKFLEKYPSHQSKKFVEEIVIFNKNTQETDI